MSGHGGGWQEVGDRAYCRRYPSFDLNVGAILGEDEVLLVDTRNWVAEATELLADLRLPDRSDMVLRQANSGQERWFLVEAKLYGDVQDGARAALQNLLAYRRAFDTDLATNSGIYGLGIAWGTDLQPAPTEVISLRLPS